MTCLVFLIKKVDGIGLVSVYHISSPMAKEPLQREGIDSRDLSGTNKLTSYDLPL